MGKLLTFISILVFIDLLFLVTGQIAFDSPSSIILNTIYDPSNIQNLNFWTVLIGGLSGIVVIGGIVAGLVTRQSDIVIFFTMAGTLALLVPDYVSIYSYIADFNDVLAAFILMPIMVIFTFIIIEWARGKD